MVPVFFAIMIFGLLATNLTVSFSDQQRQIIVESYEGKLTSTIQQLYYIMKEEKIQPCTVTLNSPLPSLIDGQNYEVAASVNSGSLNLVFHFPGLNVDYSTIVPLGPDFSWSGGPLRSDSSAPGIQVVKSASGYAFSFR
jgi:hypothetical protein